MNFKYKNTDVTIRYTFRSLIHYERIMNEGFNPTRLENIVVLFYCCLISCNRDLTTTFEEFLDFIDEKPEVVFEFSSWLTKEFSKERVKEDDDNSTTEKKSKRTRKTK